MTGKSYKNLYYHIVFGTKLREPFLNHTIKDQVYHFIFNKCKRMGLYLHKMGGAEDHVHMLAYIPPKIPVANVIGQIKGSSSYFINQELIGNDILYWQRGYGVLTISEKDIPGIKKYIMNQEIHHFKGTARDELEENNFDG